MIGICRMTVRYRSQRPDDGRRRERMKATPALVGQRNLTVIDY